MKLTALKELLTQRYQTIDDLNQKFQQSYDEKQVDNSNSRFKEELDFAVSLNERYCRAVVFVLRVFSGQDTVKGFTTRCIKIGRVEQSRVTNTMDKLQSETEFRRRVYIEVPRLRFGLRVLHR